MPDGETWFNNRPQKETKWKSLLLTKPGRTTGIFPGATKEGPGRVPTGSQDLGHAVNRVYGGVLWSPRLKPDWLIQTKKEWSFGKPKGEDTGRQERMLITSSVGEVIFLFVYDSVHCSGALG